MASRKKKTVGEDAADAALVEAQSKWPKVNKGTHLTVKTYQDGKTVLEWDDDQLLKEVREAIASVSTKKAPAKKTTKGKTK